MNQRVFSVLLFSAALVAGAHASFELMLIAEETPNGARVARYDPETRTSLGSFGLGKIGGAARDVAVDKATNTCFVLGSTGLISEFNYNTGEFIKGYDIGAFTSSLSFSASTGQLLMGGYGTSNVTPARRFLNGVAANSVSPGGFATSSLVEYNGLQYVAASNTGAAPFISSVSPLGTTAILAHTSTLPNGYNQSYRDLTGAAGRLFATYPDLSGVVRLRHFTISGSLLTTPTDLGTTFGNSGNRLSLATGHGDIVYLLSNETLYAIHGPTNALLSTFVIPSLTVGGGRGMALVTAPEPGSLLAIGLGLGLVTRRRRKTTNA